MVDWIIYYDDASTFTSDDGPPEKAPKEGAIVVAVRDIGVGKLLWHSHEAYCWHLPEGEWVPHSATGLQRYLAMTDGGKEPGIVVMGYAVPYRRWVAIYNQAVDDPRLGFKTAPDQRETEPPIGF